MKETMMASTARKIWEGDLPKDFTRSLKGFNSYRVILYGSKEYWTYKIEGCSLDALGEKSWREIEPPEKHGTNSPWKKEWEKRVLAYIYAVENGLWEETEW